VCGHGAPAAQKRPEAPMTRWLIGFAVVVTVIASIVLSRSARAPDGIGASLPTAADPGYLARDAEMIETGDDGRPRYRLDAELIEQAPNDPTITLSRPVMHYADPRGGTWRASADQGTVAPPRDVVELTGDVLLTGTLADGGDPAHITTSRLTFDAGRDVAHTSAPVTIEWSGHRLTARGVRADLGAETLRLESAVHGNFLPP